MKIVNVSLKNRSYKIAIGSKVLAKTGKMVRSLNIGTDAIVVTNPAIGRLYGKAIASSLKKSGISVKVLDVPDGEKSKSARCAFSLLDRIAQYDVKRRVFLIALGGGVVGDLTGYVAAIYKRGVPYVQVPTTLLAQIDSAIGGKVAIDLPAGKNLVGAFYQPKLVLSDVDVLSTLSRRQIKNGLAEAVKYGVISDVKLFEYLARNYDKLLSCEPLTLETVVLACSRIKARVVERDERETKGLRTILNFGHTAGHAIEAAGRYGRYQHGEAVAVGMRIAADLAVRMRLLKPKDAITLEKVLSDIGLSVYIRGVRLARIMKTMQHDKKFSGRTNRFVLPVRIGAVKVVENVPQPLIEKAIRSRIK